MENMSNKVEELLNKKIADMAPVFCQDIDTWEQVQAIQQGGCASGAYMPAVTYHSAIDMMAACDEEVMTYLSEMGTDLGGLNEHSSFAGIAVHLLSTAVDTWAFCIDLDELREEIEADA